MPTDKFLVILAGISIFSIFLSISIYVAIIFAAVYFPYMIYIKFDLSGINVLKNIHIKKHAEKISDLKYTEDGALFCRSGSTNFTVIEIKNKDMYTDGNKQSFFLIYSEFLSAISSDIAFITKHHEINAISNGSYNYYHTYIILKNNIHDMNLAISSLKKDIDMLKSLKGINAELIEDKKIVEGLFPSNIEFQNNYFKIGKLYGAMVDVTDTNYNSDYFYQLLIESMKFPIEINITASKLKNYEKTLARMKAARQVELKFEKNSRNKIVLKRQINDLGYFQTCNELYNVFIRFTIFSDHPVGLKMNLNNFVRAMEYRGIKLSHFNRFSDTSFNPLKLNHNGNKYMLDNRSIAELVPVSFTEFPDNAGILVGFNSLTGKPAYINVFNSNSYNVAITGETGSGKSYFAGMLYRNADVFDHVYIIDPLNEYKDGQIININDGEYIDFKLNSRESVENVANIISRIAGDNNDAKIMQFIDDMYSKNDDIFFSEILKNLISNYEYSGNSNFYRLISNFRHGIKVENRKIIFRYNFNGSEGNNTLFRFIFTEISGLISHDNGNKAVVVDEAHLILNDAPNAEVIDLMARNSRHYNTSLIVITQNIDDFYMNSYSKSILLNSKHNFVFRQKSTPKEKIFIDMDIDTSGLKGGKLHGHSECFYIKEKSIKRLEIKNIN